MRRWGDGDRFLRRIDDIRARRPDAAFRTNFIVGYPARPRPTTTSCCRSSSEAQLDWCGFFSFSREDGTYAADLDGAGRRAGSSLSASPSCATCKTTSRRRRSEALIGSTIEVLVDAAGVGRSHREAPEIDGIVEVPRVARRSVRSRTSRSRRHGARPGRRPRGLTMATSFGPSALATPANGVTVATSARGAVPLRDDRWHRRLVASVRPLVRAVRHRWHRRVPRAAARHDAVGRVPRPARRQGARPRRDARAGQAGRVLVAAGRADRRTWRSRSACTAAWRAVRGITIPARRGAKVKTVCQQFAVGFALLPWSADARWLFNDVPLGRGRAHVAHRRAVPARLAPSRPHTAA